jgi:hypothetical protein
MGRPRNLKELFAFYYEEFKPIYSELAAEAEAPTEMLFEVNAAFDHLSRLYEYAEPESETVNLVCGHLKRGCFDAFKIIFKRASDQHKKLQSVDTSIIDNGDFDRRMHALWAETKRLSIEARNKEGDSRNTNVDSWHDAFARWRKVYVGCKQFESDFFLNKHVEWARRKQNRKVWILRFEGFVTGVLASLVASWLWKSISGN